MLDREPPDSLRVVETRNSRLRREPIYPATGVAVEPLASAPVLSSLDRRTWEDFWSTLLGEYEHLSQDLAEAA